MKVHFTSFQMTSISSRLASYFPEKSSGKILSFDNRERSNEESADKQSDAYVLLIGASVGLANKPNTRPVGQPNMPCVGQANNYIQLTCWRPTNCWPNTRVNGKFRANMKYIRSLRVPPLIGIAVCITHGC